MDRAERTAAGWFAALATIGFIAVVVGLGGEHASGVFRIVLRLGVLAIAASPLAVLGGLGIAALGRERRFALFALLAVGTAILGSILAALP